MPPGNPVPYAPYDEDEEEYGTGAIYSPEIAAAPPQPAIELAGEPYRADVDATMGRPANSVDDSEFYTSPSGVRIPRAMAESGPELAMADAERRGGDVVRRATEVPREPKKPGIWKRIGNAALAAADQFFRPGSILGIPAAIVEGAQASKTGQIGGAYGDRIRNEKYLEQRGQELAIRRAESEVEENEAQAAYYRERPRGGQQQRPWRHVMPDGTVITEGEGGGLSATRAHLPGGDEYSYEGREQKPTLYPGTDGYHRLNEYGGMDLVPGSPIPPSGVTVINRAEEARLETDDEIDTRLQGLPEFDPNAMVDNPDLPAGYAAGAREKAIDEAVKDGRLDYNAQELAALRAVKTDTTLTPEQQLARVNEIDASMRARFDQLKEAQYYLDRAMGGKSAKVRAGDTRAYKDRFGRRQTQERAKRDGQRRDIRTGTIGGPVRAGGRPAVSDATSAADAIKKLPASQQAKGRRILEIWATIDANERMTPEEKRQAKADVKEQILSSPVE